jgi:hypothetical protein
MAPSRTLWWKGEENAGLTSLWQLMQSCGSFIFNILMVEKPGFSAFAVVTRTFELARFLPDVLE